MWLVSGRIREGIPTWTDPTLVDELIDRRRAVSAAPGRRHRDLIEQRYEQACSRAFRGSPDLADELHPIATEIAAGGAVDLRALDHRSSRPCDVALRASATLPLLAGSPVTVDGKRYLDAGLSAAIPFHAAFADGATHVLLLRSRQPRGGHAAPAGVRRAGNVPAAAAGQSGGRPRVSDAGRARGRRRGTARPPRR